MNDVKKINSNVNSNIYLYNNSNSNLYTYSNQYASIENIELLSASKYDECETQLDNLKTINEQLDALYKEKAILSQNPMEGATEEYLNDYNRIEQKINVLNSQKEQILSNNNLELYIDDKLNKLYNEKNLLSQNSMEGVTEEFLNQSNTIDNDIKKFEEYQSLLSGKYSKIDYSQIEDDGFVVQGLTVIGQKYYISAYTKDKSNSRIYIYNNFNELEGKIILDNNAHVGGLTYDTKNNLLIVTGSNGHVNAYNYEIINNLLTNIDNVGVKTIDLNNIDGIKIENNQNLMEGSIREQTATIYWYDGYLYVANHHGTDKCDLIKYSIDYDVDSNSITYNKESQIKIPRKIQGIAITKYKNKDYLLVTQSYGSTAYSEVIIYEYDKDGNKSYIGGYYDKKGLEGIKVSNSGEVTLITENYSESIVTTMDEILERTQNGDSYEGWAVEIAQFFDGRSYELFHDKA